MKTLLAIAALATAMTGAAAHAQPSNPDVKTAVVRYDDLNLATARGRAVLDARIAQAAVNVCDATGSTRDLASHFAQQACVKSAISDSKMAIAAKSSPTYAAR
jgi:UrcA family protein